MPRRCPACRATEVRAIRRRWWMRWLPGVRRYECRTCAKCFVGLSFW